MVGHSRPEQTEEQIANCRKLAAYLRTLPADYPDFEMRDFVTGNLPIDHDRFAHVTCGTAACAVGHGPAAKIEPMPNELWMDYSWRAFVDKDEDDAWEWCFCSTWSKTDNTVHGAAARIEYMLVHGVPENSPSQKWGEAPLSYTVAA